MPNPQTYPIPAWEDMLDSVGSIIEENERLQMVTGNAFTPFVGGIINLDELTASRILGILLDPAAAHGQRALFLKLFLRLLEIPEAYTLKTENVRHVRTERTTYGKDRNRRIDIVVECDNLILGVENKLGAGDQEDQLADYLDWLKTKSRNKPYYLVYLTPDGHEPSDYTLSAEARAKYQGHWCALSWLDLTNALIESCVWLPIKVANFVLDFCMAIRMQKMGKERMTIDKNVVDYLSWHTTDEQLKAAHAISQSYASVADQLIFDWIERLKRYLSEKVKGTVESSRDFCKDYGGVQYLTVKYDKLYMSVDIMNLDEWLCGVPAHTVTWGTVIHSWKFADLNLAMSDPWIAYIMARFDATTITSNMLSVHECGHVSDPVFLAKLRDHNNLYLFDDLLENCQEIEKQALIYGIKP